MSYLRAASSLGRSAALVALVATPLSVRSASASEPVPATGSNYETDADSLDVVLPDGVAVHLEPSTRARVLPPVFVPAEHGGKPLRSYHVQVRGGEITVRVPDGGATPKAILVSTPNGSVTTAWRGVHGFRFERGTASVAAYQGAAQVGSAAHYRIIATGHAAVVKDQDPPDTQHTVLAAPEWRDASSPPSYAVVVPDASAAVGAAWSAVPSATGYAYEVASDPEFRTIVARGKTNDTSLATPALAAGTYYARVRAAGPDAIPGAPSATKTLTIARLGLPAEGFVARDGTIVLPRSGTLGLDDARGVLASTYGMRSTRWPAPDPSWMRFSPAPRKVGLDDDEEAKIVFLRDPVSGYERSLRLVRNELRADVEMLPKRAKWPEDAVQIIVRVHDPSGRADASNIDLTLKAQVDLEEVPLKWSHKGDVWAAQLAPRVPPGPWVVRVQAYDARTGSQMGAGVLEIDGPRVAGRGKRLPDSIEVSAERP